jgi:signal transduction histidine kinase
MQHIYPNRQIEFSQSCFSTFVWLDPKLMKQAITNLLSNAIKYSPADTSVQLNLSCENDLIELSVRDHGIGIPDSDQQHLFETFYRASNVSDIAGTGLGLAIVKQAAEAHNGVVSYESRVGEGTSFTLTLPLIEQPEFRPTS